MLTLGIYGFPKFEESVGMTDWNLVAKIAGGGFGVTLLVLIILLLVSQLMGLVIQKSQRRSKAESVKAK